MLLSIGDQLQNLTLAQRGDTAALPSDADPVKPL